MKPIYHKSNSDLLNEFYLHKTRHLNATLTLCCIFILELNIIQLKTNIKLLRRTGFVTTKSIAVYSHAADRITSPIPPLLKPFHHFMNRRERQPAFAEPSIPLIRIFQSWYPIRAQTVKYLFAVQDRRHVIPGNLLRAYRITSSQ